MRLIGLPTGYVLGEHAVSTARGSHGFALPAADSSYIVELAVMRSYRWTVLARSNAVHAPPHTPRVATTPAFVSRAEQQRAVAQGLTLGDAGERGRVVPLRVTARPRPAPTTPGRGRAEVAASAGSEARLRQADSELRRPGRGSEPRLARREGEHVPFVIARTAGIPQPVAAALSELAAAVWFGRDPVDVLAAGNALVSALAEAGIAHRPAIAILDPPDRDAAAEPGPQVGSRPDADGYSVTENPEGSITVSGPDGSSITYNPVERGAGDGPAARSAAAVVWGRHAP